jgi:tetratricopeptide (TPR) repeat protein
LPGYSVGSRSIPWYSRPPDDTRAADYPGKRDVDEPVDKIRENPERASEIVTPEHRNTERQLPVTMSVEAQRRKQEGNKAYKRKDFSTALSKYGEAIALEPNEITYYLNTAAVHFEMKDYTKCVSTCNEAINVGRKNRADSRHIAKGFARMGNAYKKSGNLTNAKAAYDIALTEHHNKDYKLNLSEIEADLRAEEQACVGPGVTEKKPQFKRRRDSENNISTYVQQSETGDAFIKHAAAEAINMWEANINPHPANPNNEGERKTEHKTNTGLDYLDVWESMTSEEPLIREAAKNLINATASCTSAVFTGEGRRNCRLCRSQMQNGYKEHLSECYEYQDAIRNKWCPICCDNHPSANKTRTHLRSVHYMSD